MSALTMPQRRSLKLPFGLMEEQNPPPLLHTLPSRLCLQSATRLAESSPQTKTTALTMHQRRNFGIASRLIEDRNLPLLLHCVLLLLKLVSTSGNMAPVDLKKNVLKAHIPVVGATRLRLINAKRVRVGDYRPL